MKKPEKKDYGYIENNAFDADKSGWAYEDGEYQYYKALKEWNLEQESKNKPLTVLPTLEEIEMRFPCELGQDIIMEKDMSYDDTRQANYYRRQGAKWLYDLLKNPLNA